MGRQQPCLQVFLRAPLSMFLNIPAASADMHVVVWVGDDARETDDDPFRDGGGGAGDGRGAVRVHAEAFGRTGAAGGGSGCRSSTGGHSCAIVARSTGGDSLTSPHDFVITWRQLSVK